MFNPPENGAEHAHFEGSCNAEQQVEQCHDEEQGPRKQIGSQSSLPLRRGGTPSQCLTPLSFSFLTCEEPPESQHRGQHLVSSDSLCVRCSAWGLAHSKLYLSVVSIRNKFLSRKVFCKGLTKCKELRGKNTSVYIKP